MPARHEWQLKPSMRLRRRQYLALAWLLAVVLAFAVTKQFYWSLLLMPALAWKGLRLAPAYPAHLGCDQNGWWWQQQGRRQQLLVCSGSVRRHDQVKLQYGHWPWQYWLLLSDQFRSDEDFRQLRRCLYRDF